MQKPEDLNGFSIVRAGGSSVNYRVFPEKPARF
jgi:hypothetical protein